MATRRRANEIENALVEDWDDGLRSTIERVLRARVRQRSLRSNPSVELSDLVQEACCRVLEAMAREDCEPIKNRTAYAQGTAFKVLASHLRCAIRERKALARWDDGTCCSLPSSLPDEILGQNQLQQLIEAWLASNPELVAVWNERFELNRSQRTTAEELGVTHRRIRTLEEQLVQGLIAELESQWSIPDVGERRPSARTGTPRRR